MNVERLAKPIVSNQIVYRDAKQVKFCSERISPNAIKVVKTLQKAGYEAYIVGGSIRDVLIGGTPKDFDVATSAKPNEIIQHFSRCRIIGRRFKIVHVWSQREMIEVTTFRSTLQHDATDSGQEVRNGMVVRDNEYGSLAEDMMRRDFTVNAMYYDPVTNKIVAHADAFADIKHARLKYIGDPWQGYREDPVRMLRAVRFTAKTHLQLDAEAANAIVPLSQLLREVSPARLFEEVIKLFHSGAALQAYRLLQKYQLFSVLFPFVDKSLADDTGGKKEALLEALFVNTDERIAIGKPVIPPFSIAVILWLSLPSLVQGGDLILDQASDEMSPGPQSISELRLALFQVLDLQNRYVVVPRRFAHVSIEICLLQVRFEDCKMKSMYYLLTHQRFRAAYDLFCLRANVGLASQETATWWTQLQEMDEKDQRSQIKQRAGRHAKRYVTRRRRR